MCSVSRECLPEATYPSKLALGLIPWEAYLDLAFWSPTTWTGAHNIEINYESFTLLVILVFPA